MKTPVHASVSFWMDDHQHKLMCNGSPVGNGWDHWINGQFIPANYTARAFDVFMRLNGMNASTSCTRCQIVIAWLLANEPAFTENYESNFAGHRGRLAHQSWLRALRELGFDSPARIEAHTPWREKCLACNGSGHYDHNGAPPCGSCGGTGFEETGS